MAQTISLLLSAKHRADLQRAVEERGRPVKHVQGAALSEQRQVVRVRHSLPRPKRVSGRERAPLAERGRASLFVDFAGHEMTFRVEMVVDLSVN